MGTFAPSELVSSTDFVRNFGEYSKSLKNSKIQKLGILKNNNLDMVVIPGKVYETIGNIVKSVFGDREITEERINRLKGMNYKEIEKNFYNKETETYGPFEGEEIDSYFDAIIKEKEVLGK